MGIERNETIAARFNRDAELPYNLRLKDFELGMQDVYDFFHDVNTPLVSKGLKRLDDMLRPSIMSGLLSDKFTSGMLRSLISEGMSGGSWEHVRRR
jgi:hypothetical protein